MVVPKRYLLQKQKKAAFELLFYNKRNIELIIF